MINKITIVLLCVAFNIGANAQIESDSLTNDETGIDDLEFGIVGEEEQENSPVEIFSGTRVINGHSVETLMKNELELRIEHRFGDVIGGFQTMFGFDNAADIRLGFEYGITDKLMMGIGRSKGTGRPYRSLIDGFVKYKAMEQRKSGMPISMAVLGATSFTYMTASEDLSQVTSFPKWQHRLAYTVQVVVAKKFGSWLGLSLSPTMVHRNYVPADDVNTLFALGGAARISVTPTMGIILEYFYAFRDQPFMLPGPNNTNKYRNSLGIAFEFVTFGHNFTINLTNSKGFGETQFIPYTYEDWALGEFRLGFTVGRKFFFGE
jgi:hypothetical protein